MSEAADRLTPEQRRDLIRLRNIPRCPDHQDSRGFSCCTCMFFPELRAKAYPKAVLGATDEVRNG